MSAPAKTPAPAQAPAQAPAALAGAAITVGSLKGLFGDNDTTNIFDALKLLNNINSNITESTNLTTVNFGTEIIKGNVTNQDFIDAVMSFKNTHQGNKNTKQIAIAIVLNILFHGKKDINQDYIAHVTTAAKELYHSLEFMISSVYATVKIGQNEAVVFVHKKAPAAQVQTTTQSLAPGQAAVQAPPPGAQGAPVQAPPPGAQGALVQAPPPGAQGAPVQATVQATPPGAQGAQGAPVQATPPGAQGAPVQATPPGAQGAQATAAPPTAAVTPLALAAAKKTLAPGVQGAPAQPTTATQPVAKGGAPRKNIILNGQKKQYCVYQDAQGRKYIKYKTQTYLTSIRGKFKYVKG